MNTTLAFFGTSIGAPEIIVIAVLGLLLFGRRLPEVGRSLGKGIVEFKKGLKGIHDDVEDAGEEDERKKLEADRTTTTADTTATAQKADQNQPT